jgi:hypothetical protein
MTIGFSVTPILRDLQDRQIQPLPLEIQTDRNVDSLLRKQVVKLGAAQVIGGRDRVRTCDPLLAKTRTKIYLIGSLGFVLCRSTRFWT